MWGLPQKVPMQALLAAATRSFSSGVSSRAPRRLNTRFDMNQLLEHYIFLHLYHRANRKYTYRLPLRIF